FNVDDGRKRDDYPTDDAPHRTGGAVDVTLSTDAGEILEMGTAFDEMSSLSSSAMLEDSHDGGIAMRGAVAARRVLFWAMRRAGFTNYPAEWWHFDFGNAFWKHFGRRSTQQIYRTVLV